MKNIFKFIIFLALFTLILIYSVKSIFSFKEALSQYNILHPQYLVLSEQNDQLKLQMQIMLNKVVGIREKTLNRDVLEERVKLMLNYKNPNEIVLNMPDKS